MRTQMNAMLAESGLDPFESDELVAFLMSLESLADASAPTPSPALNRMLAGGAAGGTGAAVIWVARRHQNALAAAALAVSAIVATGVAAAANDLPTSVQRVVAEFSHRFLPFDFPYPEVASEGLVGQTDHTVGQRHDPDRGGGPREGVDDGEALVGGQDGGQDGGPALQQPAVDSSDPRDSDDESGDEGDEVSDESQSESDESGTSADADDADDREDDGGAEESSSGESDDLTEATTGGDDLDDSTGDTSGEDGGDATEPDDDTRDSTEAIAD